jgi:phosphate:Na+ symporter
MGKGLAQASGGKLERILERLTTQPLKALLLGAGVTAVIQSSSATTVMVVGFVNSGIMKLNQAVGIIMGANIGTTITSWILSLAGLESSNFFVKLLKQSSFSPVLAMIGVVFLLFSQKEKKKDAGLILVGFAILMTGMDSMSQAVKPLANVPQFTGILTMFANPILGMASGAILTAVIQSSSASVGILQALCATGAISYETAVPIILGQNIGTCVTAMLSGIGANKNARRAALIHLYFNLIGTALFLTTFYLLNGFFHFSFMGQAADAVGIALVHTAFNVSSAIMLLPFSEGLVKLACLTIPETGEERMDENKKMQELQLLDVRFLDSPGYAAEQSRIVAGQMGILAKEALEEAVGLLNDYTNAEKEKVLQLEEQVDHYEDQLGTYLVRLSAGNLSEQDSRLVSVLLHCIGDFERISDHAVNVAETAEELYRKRLEFSSEAKAELQIFTAAILEIVSSSMEAFRMMDLERAGQIEPLEETIDDLNREMKKRHVKRLREGNCTMELGFMLSDLTTNYERISDHCSNVAIAMIQFRTGGYEAHEYAAKLHLESNPDFQEKYRDYQEKYKLP